jgi:predicted enzyme related to lactoylglutathione lyase
MASRAYCDSFILFGGVKDGAQRFCSAKCAAKGQVLRALRAEGCQVLETTDDSEYGKFGWVIDPEGNKVELWQPPPGQ